jgi:hypothetical protein
MSRIATGIKVLLLEWRAVLGWPVGILGLSFGISVGIYAFLGDEARESSQTFGLAALLIVWFVVHVQLVTDHFSFAVGFGLTRRDFFGALAVLTATQAAAYGLAVAALARIEDTTSGWGVALEFFRPAGLDTGGIGSDALVWAVSFLGAGTIAVLAASVQVRWGTRGSFAIGSGVLAAGGILAILVTAADRWGTVVDWFGEQSAFMLLAVWPLPVLAVLAAAGYATLRRMVP